ncbi:MAG: hypothetical protein WCJ72_03320 [Chryseobacterium sp.]
MRSLKIGKYKEKFYTPGKKIQEHDKDLRKKAFEISKNHKDQKPVKYLTKK